jgi:hypothetical protein
MSSKTIMLRALDAIFIAFTVVLLLAAAGVPIDWLLAVMDMSSREFRAFAAFILCGVLLLSHAIATSDSAP